MSSDPRKLQSLPTDETDNVKFSVNSKRNSHPPLTKFVYYLMAGLGKLLFEVDFVRINRANCKHQES